jgi:hypothetical protein
MRGHDCGELVFDSQGTNRLSTMRRAGSPAWWPPQRLCIGHGLITHLWTYSLFVLLYSGHVPLRSPLAPGLHVLFQARRLGGAVPRARPEDSFTQEVDLHRPAEDPRAGEAGRSMARLRQPADTRACHRGRPRWGLPEAYARAISTLGAAVSQMQTKAARLLWQQVPALNGVDQE